ncbi:MAG: SufE family protein [Nitriliruptoraceae bacterium]|nr:SufE family protein [Nitriliruptoraceae bacterium]
MALPPNLANVVNDFAASPPELKVELLVEYTDKVPALPDRYTDHPERLEQVEECQTPFFLATEIDDEDRITVWFDCPPEAPTTRGFAGILAEGLNGARVDEVLAVPDDFHHDLGLAAVISPLRMRGMDAILFRLKRQVRLRHEASEAG